MYRKTLDEVRECLKTRKKSGRLYERPLRVQLIVEMYGVSFTEDVRIFIRFLKIPGRQLLLFSYSLKKRMKM